MAYMFCAERIKSILAGVLGEGTLQINHTAVANNMNPRSPYAMKGCSESPVQRLTIHRYTTRPGFDRRKRQRRRDRETDGLS